MYFIKITLRLFLGLAAILVILALVQPYINATKLYIYTEIQIKAPKEKVWNALIATEDYPNWNPYHTKVTGKKEVGAPMRIEVQKPNGEKPIVKPHYMAIEPNKELTWGGGIPRIFFGKHVFRLEEIDAETTLLIQEENFSGLAIPFAHLESIEEGYKLCNQALKNFLES